MKNRAFQMSNDEIDAGFIAKQPSIKAYLDAGSPAESFLLQSSARVCSTYLGSGFPGQSPGVFCLFT